MVRIFISGRYTPGNAKVVLWQGGDGGKEGPMRAAIGLISILAGVVWISAAWADIYVWVDEDGLRHISNLNPPPHAEVLLHTEEPPLNDAAGSLIQEQQRRQDSKRRDANIRQREARLAQRETELERRVEAVEQKTQTALDQTAKRLAAVEAHVDDGATDYRYVLPDRTYVYGPYGYRHHRRGHRGDRKAHHRGGLSFEGHPFHLGAIHLPLGPVGSTPRRYPARDGRNH
jgi:hypothetical protein